MTTTRPGIDPVTLEVIRNRLESIVREMGDITLRTARSAVVYAGRDFSCGILSSQADLLAVGTSIPVHIFPIVWQVKNTLARFQGDVHPGDIFIGNDPYDGGTHLNDVLIFLPIFHEGEIVAYAANRAHWYDVGGMVPGSISGSSREIYQEGIRIPPIRLGQNDKLNRDIVDMILLNVRVPEESRGDILAQVASCRVAGQHIIGLIHRYGKESTLQHFDEVLDTSERRMRSFIGALPQTSVVHEGYMDNDGVETDRKRIRVRVTVEGDSLHVDYTGTALESKGPLNVGLALAHCFAFMGVKAAIDPSGPINTGCFRPIRVTAPKGTMLNASNPSPAGGMAEVGQTAIYTMVALSKLAPDHVSAEEGSGANHQNLAGTDLRFDDPHRFIYYDYPSAGGGGRVDKDGLDFVRNLRSGNVNIQSIEVLENLFPVFFHKHELRQDSGGPGRFRGGLGGIREYRTPSDGVFSMLSDHAIVPTAGLFGGHSGALGKWEVVREGQTMNVSPTYGSKSTAFPIKAGDTLRASTFGGGGYGDPLERELSRVREDVIDGKVSAEQAWEVYGVVFDAETLEVNAEATREQRARLASEQVYLIPQRGGEPVMDGGMRVAWVNPSLVERGVADGDMAETFTSQMPNALRMRVRFRPDLPPDGLLLDSEIWDMLGITADERLLWRKIGERA